MATPYPELRETVDRVAGVIRKEEEAFLGTIDAGLSRIRQMFEAMRREHSGMVDGEKAAELYQTYGVPPELLQTLAAEENFTFDWQGFRAAMEEHGRKSGGEQRELFQTGPLETLKEALRETPFVGYDTTSEEVVVRGIITGGGGQGPDDVGSLLSHVEAGGDAPLRLVLDRSPFYAESGGQVGDTGRIHNRDAEFEVLDTQKHGGLIVHVGRLVSGKLREGATVRAEVDTKRRNAIRRAHSATHLLHHALQDQVGRHAQQQGSKVEADWLRFDFTNQEGLSDDVLAKIEQQVERRIREAAPVDWKLVSLAEARQAGAMMLFGEKYPDPVRMVSMGGFSRELCGGTHVARTDEVTAFELISEESVSAGTRRMVALTGHRAEDHRSRVEQTLAEVSKLLGCSAERTPLETGQLVQDVRSLKKQIAAGKAAPAGGTPAVTSASATPPSAAYGDARRLLRDVARQMAVGMFDVGPRLQALVAERARLQQELAQLSQAGAMPLDDLLAEFESVADYSVLVKTVPEANPQVMRHWIEQLKKSAGRPTAILLATVAAPDKVVLIAGVSPELVKRGLQAGQWVGEVARQIGGSGGGRPDLAQAGGKDPSQLPAALAAARKAISDLLTR
jgi:alanyl-tRNA synthetase